MLDIMKTDYVIKILNANYKRMSIIIYIYIVMYSFPYNYI